MSDINTVPISQRILGTWRLVGVTREEVPSGVVTGFMGDAPHGYIHYGADGRMMVVITQAGRQRPQGAVATPAEAEALFRTMTSYTGTYTIDGNVLTHHVELSWNEAWSGTKQVRTATFDGNRVTLATPVSPDPVDGKRSIRRMVWEKPGT